MCSKLAVKNMACMLMTLGMKWRNGVGAAAHEPPRGEADKSMGAAEGFVVFTVKRRCLTVIGAGGEETENGGGNSCSPPTLSSLGGELGGTSLGHFHDPSCSVQSFLMLPSMWLWSYVGVCAEARKTATLGSFGPSGPTLAVRRQLCGCRGV